MGRKAFTTVIAQFAEKNRRRNFFSIYDEILYYPKNIHSAQKQYPTLSFQSGYNYFLITKGNKMRQKQIYILTALFTIFALTLNACGPSASNDSIIATSVAMTVQAQNTQVAQSTPTLPGTDVSPLPASPTAGATKAPPTAPPVGSGNAKPCLSANWVADVTYPDGTIVAPGTSFIKTWRVLNSGSCYWDSTYKFVFMSGDIMGGAYVYPFPAAAAPGQTVDVPIQLYAPQNGGTYTGKWKIQSSNGTVFGVGQYDVSLSVQIVVGSGTPGKGTATAYGVTAVSYDITRDPVAGCATTVRYYITAYITTNGPVKISYFWKHSDGYNSGNQTLTFTEAKTRAITGITASTIHAPSWNFVTATTIVTTPVTTAPIALMTAENLHPRPRSRSQWRTSPACDSVNAMKTPIVYSGMSPLTLPW